MYPLDNSYPRANATYWVYYSLSSSMELKVVKKSKRWLNYRLLNFSRLIGIELLHIYVYKQTIWNQEKEREQVLLRARAVWKLTFKHQTTPSVWFFLVQVCTSFQPPKNPPSEPEKSILRTWTFFPLVVFDTTTTTCLSLLVYGLL